MLHIYFKQHLIHHKFKRENFLESPVMYVRFQGILEVFERKLKKNCKIVIVSYISGGIIMPHSDS